MKIAFVVGYFPVLSESFIVQQIVGLINKGHDVRIYAEGNPSQPVIQKEVFEYQLLQKTSYSIRHPKKKWLLRLKGLIYLIRCFLYSPRAAVTLIQMFKKRNYFSYSEIFLVNGFLKERFDIVHAHFGPNGLRSLILKKLNLPIKFVTTFYGYDLATYVNCHGNEIYHDLFRHGDSFIYISEAGKEKLLKLGAPEEKMNKIPMGIDLKKMHFKERSYNPPEKIRLLSVGRLVEMKGREYAIKAIAKLKDRYPIQYHIVGDGELREDLQRLISDMELDDTVKLWGWVGSEQLDQLYENAHLFIHPSVTSSDGNQEGQGVVLLEAQAHGIPVIATDHGAFPDSVINGKTGFLVPERDVESLAERIDYLIKNPKLWPQMGHAGRAFVEHNYEIKELNKKLIGIFKETLRGG